MKQRIMLIDDNAIQLRTLKGILAESYEVEMVTSGIKAVKIINERRPDLIFLDYDMPECDGKETLEKIRQIRGAENVPVVFLTGVSSKDHIKAVLGLKPAGYILKPASSEKIYETVESILGKPHKF